MSMPVVSSVRVASGAVHDRVSVWNRGAHAGELVVLTGDGATVANLLRAPVVHVLSRSKAERYLPGDGDVCVSVTTPGDPSAPAKLSDRFADVLRLEVVDCDEGRASPGYNGGWLTLERAAARGDSVFDHRHALAALLFAYRNRSAPAFVIHCDAGWSRSPGLALALADVLWPGAVNESDWPEFNRHIRRIVNAVARAENLPVAVS
jgi:predicted protein tyrosine phosphatase